MDSEDCVWGNFAKMCKPSSHTLDELYFEQLVLLAAFMIIMRRAMISEYESIGKFA
jgi:hypothetical protein